jgi:hypothetical protein
VALAESHGRGRLDGAILLPRPLGIGIRLHGDGDKTYTADDLPATAALADEIAGAMSRLAIEAPATLHVIPVPRACPVTQGLVPVHGDILIGAAQSRCDERIAVLEEGIVDQEAGAGEGVEGIQVDGGDDFVNDAGRTSVSLCYMANKRATTPT